MRSTVSATFPPGRLTVGLALALTAAGCDSIVDAPRADALRVSARTAASTAPPRAPVFVSRVPGYPAPVVYILYREYLHKNPGLTSLNPENKHYQQYIERRLRQLYPARGYPGMMQDGVEEERQQRLAWAAYQKELQAWKRGNTIGIMTCTGSTFYDPETGENCPPVGGGEDPPPEPEADPTVDPSWNGQEEFPPPSDDFVPTLQMEIDSLQMTQPEIDRLYYQESLADGSFFARWDEVIVASGSGRRATLDDLIIAAGDGWTPLGRKPGPRGELTIQIDRAVVAGILLGAHIGYKAWRVDQAVDRAREKSAQYFPVDYESTKRDAYRHIFWNMQMRRYVGADVAKVIADRHEANGGNTPPDLYMDLHNNHIGREAKYHAFRGHVLWDRWDWREWAEKVRNYMNRPENAEYIAEWASSTPTREEARARASLVPVHKYIYFK